MVISDVAWEFPLNADRLFVAAEYVAGDAATAAVGRNNGADAMLFKATVDDFGAGFHLHPNADLAAGEKALLHPQHTLAHQVDGGPRPPELSAPHSQACGKTAHKHRSALEAGEINVTVSLRLHEFNALPLRRR